MTETAIDVIDRHRNSPSHAMINRSLKRKVKDKGSYNDKLLIRAGLLGGESLVWWLLYTQTVV